MEEWKDGFKPVIDKNSRVLVLGSFPSVKSRAQDFYYGNPKNRFWNVLGQALNKDVPETIEGRKNFLIENKVALWDVIERSTIDGSLDSKITLRNSIPVNFDLVLNGFPEIKLIILNGRKAYSVFKKFNKQCKTEYVYLPSTSSANVRFDVELWISKLRSILQ